MRKSWFMGILIIVGVVAVFIAFNYQGGKDAVPLSEIFPDEEVFPVEMEYEFVQEETVTREAEEEFTVAEETQAAELVTTAAAVRENVLPEKSISIQNGSAFTVQIASFRNEKKAQEALTKIRTKVPSAHIRSRNLGERGVWYRIYAGQYELRNDAEVALSGIKKNFNDSFIISP